MSFIDNLRQVASRALSEQQAQGLTGAPLGSLGIMGQAANQAIREQQQNGQVASKGGASDFLNSIANKVADNFGDMAMHHYTRSGQYAVDHPTMPWGYIGGNQSRMSGFSDNDLEVHKYYFPENTNKYPAPTDGGINEDYTVDDIITGLAINGYFDSDGYENRAQKMYEYGINPRVVQEMINQAYANNDQDRLSRAAEENYLVWGNKYRRKREKEFPTKAVIYDDWLPN